ncbi:MAG TPA: phage/plasmid primase, P4 family [Polyangiaceae bacterium]|nr:phage/plasmid primase, P4 family [Polyangiaceae bacterium]
MVARFRGQIRFCPPRKRWLVWDGKRWAWDEIGEINRRAKETVRAMYEEAAAERDSDRRKAIAQHAHASEQAKKVNAMISLAQSEEGVPVLPSALDSDPWKLNVLNGTLDLRTGKLGPHARADLITRLAPVKYSSDAKCELWDRFLNEATGGDAELARYLQRAVGYALQGTATERAFFFLMGPPGTAKSTFIDAVSAAIGDYHQSASFETWLKQTNVGGNRGDLVRLASARLVTSVEVRKDAKFDEAIIKAVTGGDEITAAAKFEAEITFRPSFALWLAANDAPAIRDDDEGAWARVRRIPFEHIIPIEKQDRALKQKLAAPEVRAAVLAWAVQGCLDWQTHGLGTAKAIEASTEAYRKDMDRIAGFFDDCCEFGEYYRVPRNVLRISYEQWCKENGIRTPLAGKVFAARLRERGCKDAKSNGKKLWSGVRLTEPVEGSPGSGRDPNSPEASYKADMDGSRENVTLGGPAAPDDERQAIIQFG